ncbi:unnamed protein product [Cuscuta europaea]|uniref:DUF8039 domain-containing protein n=1 Tax=Cuscuta europaea TaxID=41803 RepID=A0A9P0ZMP4_CUSEU|nr:unnamed protein product [Cuscuta europaea]
MTGRKYKSPRGKLKKRKRNKKEETAALPSVPENQEKVLETSSSADTETIAEYLTRFIKDTVKDGHSVNQFGTLGNDDSSSPLREESGESEVQTVISEQNGQEVFDECRKETRTSRANPPREMDDQPTPPTQCKPKSQSRQKKGRHGTRLTELISNRSAHIRLPIDFHAKTGKPIGPHKNKFKSFVALLGRSFASILRPNWKSIEERVKNQIWESIQLTFDVPNDPRLRKRWISFAGARWRGFKTQLTSQYIFGNRCDQSPCEEYPFIDQDTWRQFVLSRQDPAFLERRQKAKKTQALNVCPHILSRGGYELLEEKMMAGKLKNSEEPSQPDPSETLDPPPPLLLPRHEKWKAARKRPSGEFTTQESRMVAQKIDSLVEESTQGTFVPKGREDILTAALGRSEHPGRVRAAGWGVGIREYFGPPVRPPVFTQEDVDRIKWEVRQEVTQELTQLFSQKLQDELAKMGFAPLQQQHTQVRDSCFPASVSVEGSNAPDASEPDDDDEMCQLYIDSPFHLVAMGKVHELGPTIHHETIAADIVRVEVIQALDAAALVPITTDEVRTVGQALNHFISWPRRLIGALEFQDGGGSDQDDAPYEHRDPLSRLRSMATHLGPHPVELILRKEVTGMADVPLYVRSEEIMEICLGNQMLSAIIIQVWVMYLHGICVQRKNVHFHGFLDLQLIQDVGNRHKEIQTYIQGQLKGGGKECYLAPYFYPTHWQLFVLCPRQNTIVFFCSLGNKPKNNIKSVMNMAMKGHQVLKPTRKISPKWVIPKSRMQMGDHECGYYVMRQMFTIIYADDINAWIGELDTQDAFTEQEINDVRERWASYLCDIKGF